jgi:predicted Zn-dependent protease
LLLRLKQLGAAEQYEKVLERIPDDEAATIGLAACRIQEGRPTDAIPLLDRVLEQIPTSATAWLLRGKIARQQDQLENAERCLRESVRLAPNDPEALYQLSQVVRSLNREAEADQLSHQADQLRKDYARLDELNRLILSKPDNPRLRHEAGVIALRLGRGDEGLHWLHSLLRLKGDHHETHAVLADWYSQKGEQAPANYHRSLAEAP